MYLELFFWILSGDCGNCCFLKKFIFKIILYLFIFYPKTSIFHKSGMVRCRKLPDLSLNNIFSALAIGLQYTLSFKWSDSVVPCYNNPKRSVLEIKGWCTKCNFSFSKTGRNCNPLFKLKDRNWIVIMKHKRKIEVDI